MRITGVCARQLGDNGMRRRDYSPVSQARVRSHSRPVPLSRSHRRVRFDTKNGRGYRCTDTGALQEAISKHHNVAFDTDPSGREEEGVVLRTPGDGTLKPNAKKSQLLVEWHRKGCPKWCSMERSR
ncbi:hypothetical protein SKAU_G00015710 [Synaphobranchus kaupii]|uniref:Uncharacterized protein n=1 Tax=Synaphobranchus kaupii TaxID=118154 RepID=A0A9Q1GC11_SYNKA|nr:hypothetical protein SKAU_G00015710 [Synaphobranchus kaupii]